MFASSASLQIYEGLIELDSNSRHYIAQRTCDGIGCTLYIVIDIAIDRTHKLCVFCQFLLQLSINDSQGKPGLVIKFADDYWVYIAYHIYTIAYTVNRSCLLIE